MPSPCSCRGCTEAYNAGLEDATEAARKVINEWTAYYDDFIAMLDALEAISRLKHVTGADIQKLREASG